VLALWLMVKNYLQYKENNMYSVDKLNLFEAPRGVGFTGVLLKDGEKIADISNPGDGSCDDIRFVRSGFTKFIKESPTL